MRVPRIVIAAPGSGSGKTLVSIALMKAFANSGKKVAAFKCGPDYIDPLFHKKILGVPSKNLDLFFTDKEITRRLFCDGNESDISVVEGVMGLYDGLAGYTDTASTYQLAAALEAPVILVVNARGVGRSVVAQIKGFVSLDEKRLIKGVVLNNMSESLYGSLKPLIEAECGITVLGFVPTMKELNVESRYLGLKLPDEIEDIKLSVEKAAAVLCESVSVEKIAEIAEGAPELVVPCANLASPGVPAKNATNASVVSPGAPELSVVDVDVSRESAFAAPVRIAVARDPAFCFYYEDNLRLLERLGAELVPFSPITDAFLPPDIDGLILGGGYPELYAEKLEQNVSMRNAVKSAVAGGLPSLAECGGFMYLHERIQTADGVFHSMAGVIKGDCTYTGKSVRFGYCTVTENSGAFFGEPLSESNVSDAGESAGSSGVCQLQPTAQIKAHEFHYFDSSACGESCTAEKPVTGRSWKCCYTGADHWWGFPHLYYPSNPRFAELFVEKCRAYSKLRMENAHEPQEGQMSRPAQPCAKTQSTCVEDASCIRATETQPSYAETATDTRVSESTQAVEPAPELRATETPTSTQPTRAETRKSCTTKNYKFFQNRACEMFPCHKTDDPENFNCLFCFCPLYFSGEKCGGNFHYNTKGRKSCVDCTFPHKKENYDALMDKIRTLLK